MQAKSYLQAIFLSGRLRPVKLTPEEVAVMKRIQSAGGVARAEKLPRARRVAIAKKASKARWDKARAERAS